MGDTVEPAVEGVVTCVEGAAVEGDIVNREAVERAVGI